MKVSKKRLTQIVTEELKEVDLRGTTDYENPVSDRTGPTEMGERPMITKEQADEFTRIFTGIFWDDAINFYRKEVNETAKLYSAPSHRLDMSNIDAAEMFMAAYDGIWKALREDRKGDVLAHAIRSYLEQFVHDEQPKKNKWWKQ
jgi:hypothetical protein|tara:strand:+ start:1622 stop:2056 length:435 start_codon:yes stop_codon:yes gene_type:complete